MTHPSIRKNLLVRCGLGVGVLLLMLSVVAYLVVRHGLYRELDQSLEQSAALLANEVELENNTVTYEWQEGLGTNNELTNSMLFEYWDQNTGRATRSPMLGGADLPQFFGTNGAPLLTNIELHDGRRARAIGLRIFPYIVPAERERLRLLGSTLDPTSQPQVLVVARDTRRIDSVLKHLGLILAAGVALTLALGFLLIDRVVRASLRPIAALAAQVSDRTGQQVNPLDVSSALPVELTGLTNDLNLLLARVSATRDRERDFIRHAAHELRTPIAGLLAATELALSRPRDAATYAEHLEICRNSAEQLCDLVQRLTALARYDQAHPVAVFEPVNISELLDECLLLFTPIFAQRTLVVRKDFPSDTHVTSDRTLLRIIATNLLDNAAAYAPERSEVKVTCEERDGLLRVAVSNILAGPAPEVERLFEPLFRQDKSRSDADLHLGIGLTLSRDAAISMGAKLEATLPEPGKIEFVLTLAGALTGFSSTKR